MLFNKRIIGLDGCELVSTTEYTAALFAIANVVAPQVCPRCGSSHHRIKSTECRKVRHGEFDRRALFVEIKVGSRTN